MGCVWGVWGVRGVWRCVGDQSENSTREFPLIRQLFAGRQVQTYEFILQKIAKQTGIEDPNVLVETY